MPAYTYEYTDTLGGDANYSWVKRGTVSVPELTAYGYDGALGYTKASSRQEKHAMRQAKAALGLAGVRGTRESWGETIVFRPYKSNTILFLEYAD